MENYKHLQRYAIAFLMLFTFNLSHAESTMFSGENFFTYSLIALAAVLIFSAIITVSNTFLNVEAKRAGVDASSASLGISGGSSAATSGSQTSSRHIKLKKGHNINITGKAELKSEKADVQRYSIMPEEFIGMSPIPKVTVEVGDDVKAGDVLFYDKKRPEVKYVSPVSGEVVEVRRGEKRSITKIVILGDKEMKYKKLDAIDIDKASRETIINYLLENGGWPLIIQRPFDVVPDESHIPANIFISTFSTKPNGADLSYAIKDREDDFQAGINLLSKMTDGKVYLGLDGNKGKSVASVYSNAKNAEKVFFSGPHPAGNVGVQIHHIAPIKSNDVVWTLGVQEVATLGAMVSRGIYDAQRTVAITGGEVKSPNYVHTYQGASVNELLNNRVKGTDIRKICGDVLSGHECGDDDFMSFHADQISVIAEGDHYELFGWLFPIKPRPSISGTFPNFLFKNYNFNVDTNTHGEKRAFVVTGEYEKVMPMNIYVQHLMKAILTNNFEKMEGLGIYELTEEDVALCEFVCTSKMPLQKILREGLETMREQQ